MRKPYLFCLALLLCFHVKGQYRLSGTAYTQRFDSLHTGLPEGWEADSNAKAASLGGAATLNGTPSAATRWNNAGGGFKNVASANGFTSYKAATAGLQLAATDRALGVRQTGSFGDPGAAFTFRIDNTFRLSDFELKFRLQTLDSNSGRSTEWLVQYAIGDSPVTFTTQAVYRTGGWTFENQAVTVSFGALLDDQAERVWIRIVALAASTGSGSRTTTAIDDFELNWKGVAVPEYRPLVQRLFPANGATDVKPGSILSVRFSRHISLGTMGNVSVSNETDNTVQVIPAGSASLTSSGRELLIADVLLDPEKTYHVTFDSSIADTAGIGNYALNDTSKWRFSTAPLLGVQHKPSREARLLVIDEWDRTVELLLADLLPGRYTIAIAGASGQYNSTKEIVVLSAHHRFRLDDAVLPPGLYVAMAYGRQLRLVQKFMVR